MASVDIKIDDDYFTSIGNVLEQRYGELQKGIDDYVKIMDAILEDAIMEGETATALGTFVDYARELKGLLEPIGTESKGMCAHYISEVDAADSFLY